MPPSAARLPRKSFEWRPCFLSSICTCERFISKRRASSATVPPTSCRPAFEEGPLGLVAGGALGFRERGGRGRPPRRRAPLPASTDSPAGCGRMSCGRCAEIGRIAGQAGDPVHQVAQLADIAGIVVMHQEVAQAQGVSLTGRRLSWPADFVAEIGHQQRNLVAALTQCRQRHMNHTEPVEQVFAEGALLAHPPQVLVGGRHDARVHRRSPRRSPRAGSRALPARAAA